MNRPYMANRGDGTARRSRGTNTSHQNRIRSGATPGRGRHPPSTSLRASAGSLVPRSVPCHVVGARHAWHPSGATACIVMPWRSPLPAISRHPACGAALRSAGASWHTHNNGTASYSASSGVVVDREQLLRVQLKITANRDDGTARRSRGSSAFKPNSAVVPKAKPKGGGHFLGSSLSPRRICSSISRTALSRPTMIAREMMLCPMFNSSMYGMLETSATFW